MNSRKFALGLMVLLGLVVLAAPSSPAAAPARGLNTRANTAEMNPLAKPANAPAPTAVDLTGTWTGSLDTGNMGVDTLTLVLKKAGQSYAGTINDSLGLIDKDTAIAEVKLAGNEFSFAFKAMGGAMEFAMKLTVNGDKMTGELMNKTAGQGAPIEFVRKK